MAAPLSKFSVSKVRTLWRAYLELGVHVSADEREVMLEALRALSPAWRASVEAKAGRERARLLAELAAWHRDWQAFERVYGFGKE